MTWKRDSGDPASAALRGAKIVLTAAAVVVLLVVEM